MTTTSSTTRGILFALAGFLCLSIGDAVVKTMAGAWPPPAIAALRYVAGTIGLALLVAIRSGRAGFVVPRPWLQLWRGVAVAAATVCFFLGVHRMPLADATTLVFLAPVLTAAFSPLILREPAPPAVWGALVLAFAGVLIVLRPNLLALGPPALFPIAAACGMAALVIGNRLAAGLAPIFTMQLLVAVIATPVLLLVALLCHLSGAPGLVVGWPSWSVVARCLFVALTATTGHWFVFRATELAPAALVSPMTYVQLLGATALGWLLFGDIPDAATFSGAALIVAAGLWLFHSQAPRRTVRPAA